jgi:hypothetical protein
MTTSKLLSTTEQMPALVFPLHWLYRFLIGFSSFPKLAFSKWKIGDFFTSTENLTISKEGLFCTSFEKLLKPKKTHTNIQANSCIP